MKNATNQALLAAGFTDKDIENAYHEIVAEKPALAAPLLSKGDGLELIALRPLASGELDCSYSVKHEVLGLGQQQAVEICLSKKYWRFKAEDENTITFEAVYDDDFSGMVTRLEDAHNKDLENYPKCLK